MPKYKPVRPGKSKTTPSARGAIPCIVFLLCGMALLLLLFYSILKPS